MSLALVELTDAFTQTFKNSIEPKQILSTMGPEHEFLPYNKSESTCVTHLC